MDIGYIKKTNAAEKSAFIKRYVYSIALTCLSTSIYTNRGFCFFFGGDFPTSALAFSLLGDMLREFYSVV